MPQRIMVSYEYCSKCCYLSLSVKNNSCSESPTISLAENYSDSGRGKSHYFLSDQNLSQIRLLCEMGDNAKSLI